MQIVYALMIYVHDSLESRTSLKPTQHSPCWLAEENPKADWRFPTSSKSRELLLTRKVKAVAISSEIKKPHYELSFRNNRMVSNWDRVGQQVWWWAKRVHSRPSIPLLHRRRHKRCKAFQRTCQQPGILKDFREASQHPIRKHREGWKIWWKFLCFILLSLIIFCTSFNESGNKMFRQLFPNAQTFIHSTKCAANRFLRRACYCNFSVAFMMKWLRLLQIAFIMHYAWRGYRETVSTEGGRRIHYDR